ncbi:MAG: sodium:calcium antiporter [candidate division NC10 bacterium]|nr:sodium:calcium antiporter [candidate division NC10 bacterium]
MRNWIWIIIGLFVFMGLLFVSFGQAAAPVAPEGGAQKSVGVLVFWLLVSIAIILSGCELFANAVEHVGDKAGMSHASAGSLLAAVGTALPETLIPILALIFGAEGHKEHIGIGAILGAPFMLTTLAFFLLGCTATILWTSGRRPNWNLHVDQKAMQFDLKYFLFVIFLVFVVSVIKRPVVNYLGAALFIFLYVLYFRHMLHHESEEKEEYTDLFYFDKFFNISRNWPGLIAQLVVGLGAIILGARVFVNYIVELSLAIGISSLILALLIAPVATELPEKYNSITWTIRKQDTLAFANLTGAMTFQSMIPVSIGLVFTHWELHTRELMNLSFAFTSALIVFLTMRAKGRLPAWALLIGGIFYVVYVITIFV